MEFELEAENVRFLAEQQAVDNNAQEELRIAESQIRERLIEGMAEIRVQYQTLKRIIANSKSHLKCSLMVNWRQI